mgnify:FL=1
MKRLYHESIFYPENEEELSLLVGDTEDSGINAKALILPHGDLRRLAPLYRDALSYAKNKKRFIIIVPIHNTLLEEDKAEIALESECGILSTPLGDVNIVPSGLKVNEAYAEEEPAGELILPFIAKNFKDAAVSIIYAKIDNAKESKKLAEILKSLNSEETIFIISSNLTGKVKAEELIEKRDKNAHILFDLKYLLDVYNKKECDICASGIIDSYNRINDNEWQLIAFADNDTITAHGAFYKS